MGCKKLSFWINKIELGVKFLEIILHSRESDFDVTKITIQRMNMETNLIGISYTVTKELATLPAVPNVVIIVKARGPHEHAPAAAPIMVPIMLDPILFVFFISLTR